MAYFANGSEGEVLQAQCESCPLGEEPCPVYAAQTVFNYDACNNATAKAILDLLVADDTGACAMRPLLMPLVEVK